MLSSPLSSRNRLPKSPPSSGLKNGEGWLQEARALSLENDPSFLIKTLFGSSCGLACGRHTGQHTGRHTGRDGSEIRGPLPQCLLQYLMRPFMRPHGHPHEVPDLAFSSCFRATVLATVPPENAVFGVNFVLHCVVELPGLL